MKKPLVIVGGLLLAVGLLLGIMGTERMVKSGESSDSAAFYYVMYEDAISIEDYESADMYMNWAISDFDLSDSRKATAIGEGVTSFVLLAGGAVLLFLGLKGKKNGKMMKPMV
ncbi:MAG: hypothetical protein WCT24_00565 [Patescibacteria group bacterium]|jgi:hypothetical protein